MLHQKLREYAKLLLTSGVNLQKNQTLFISVDVESKEFAYIVTEEAYKMGCFEVVVNWRSIPVAKQRLLYARENALIRQPNWLSAYYKTYVDRKSAFLSLISATPKAFSEVPPKRLAMQGKSLNDALAFYHQAIMGSQLTWCVASVATLDWAEALNYTGTNDEKISALWMDILRLCRLVDVPEEEYITSHLTNLKKRTERLNALNLEALHYTCSNGTNLTIHLPEGHIWQGGTELANNKIEFNANIPTEEVYTAPQFNGVNGIVYATKPLIYQGNMIKNFYFKIERGDIIEIHAEKGQEILEELISTDFGSHFLGEVALVDHYSPISQSNKIFYETLYDENASCHLAIGAAYPTCIANNEGKSAEQLRDRGINYSMVHVDFMIGHEDMNIVGIKKDKTTVPIMEHGRLLV